ncbi:hypothetical protein [Acinetobacter larvae]|uniref:Carboxypeptidase regulatory-like domain-containing protein n=1 Tax=Acinetobacter larvae TaxID=1789224 RepID=A0A1B2M137_9GAMM|nr:hypothetical protein [Acinetobacter larvae]AOA58733.1 hypothetical protein BFG52_10465 [Acinetobacter larvae]
MLKLLQGSIFISSVVMVQACIPHYKMIRPALQVTVKDSQGQVIEQAKVVLVTQQRPAFVGLKYDLQMSNQQGIAHFVKRSAWHNDIMFLHGVQYYSWWLCVSKNGYQTQRYISLNAEQIKKSNRVVFLPAITDSTQDRDQDCTSTADASHE